MTDFNSIFNSINSLTFWFGTVLPAVLILVAPMLVVGGIREARKARRWRHQPTAPGVVTGAELYRFGRGKCRPRIAYRFEINGRVHESEKFFCGPENMSFGEEKSREILARYPIGTPIQVHYNPANPQESVIDTKSPAAYFYVSAAAVIAGAVSVAAILWTIEIFVKK